MEPRQPVGPRAPGRPGWAKVVLGLLVATVGIGLVWAMMAFWETGGSKARSAKKIKATAEEQARQGWNTDGKAVYDEFCAYCHGRELDGKAQWVKPAPYDPVDAPRLDAQGNSWRLTDEMLFRLTKDGGQPHALPGVESRMPSFDKVLTDEQIANAVAFIVSRWPEEIRRRRPEAVKEKS